MNFDLDPSDLEHDISDDTIAYDAKDRPVLIIHAKGLRDAVETGTAWTLDSMAVAGVPYGMFIDPDNLWIFRADSPDPREPILKFKTADIFTFYYPKYSTYTGLSRSSLAGMAESWLRDIAYHWKSERPPAIDRIEEIGLAGRLAGGTTRSDSYRAYAHLYRD